MPFGGFFCARGMMQQSGVAHNGWFLCRNWAKAFKGTEAEFLTPWQANQPDDDADPHKRHFGPWP